MGQAYPAPRTLPQPSGQTISGRVGYGTPAPGHVVVNVANDNRPKVVIPNPANDNSAYVRSTATGIARLARLGLRLHPWVRAAELAYEVLSELQQAGRRPEAFFDVDAITGNAVNRLSWDPRYASKSGSRITMLNNPPLGWQVHNLMPSNLMYPAAATANYPPGLATQLSNQAVAAPGYPSENRGYWFCRLTDNPNAWATTNRYLYVWGYRMTNSSSVPQRVPETVIPGIPRRIKPSEEPWFTPLPATSPMPLGRPAPNPIAIPGLGTLPGREVGPRPAVRPKPIEPVGPGGKERKFAIAVGGAWAAGINFATEGMDLIAALYKSLPKHIRDKVWRENDGYVDPFDKALAIFKYFDQIEGHELIHNLLDMQSEDSTWGKIGKHVKRANRNLVGGGGLTLGYL